MRQILTLKGMTTPDVYVLQVDDLAELGLEDCERLGDEIVALICAGCTRLALDLSPVAHAHFRGVQMMLAPRRRFANRYGGELAVFGASDYLCKILQVAGCSGVPSFVTEEEAVRCVAGHA